MPRLPDFQDLGDRPSVRPPRGTPMVAQYRPTTGMEMVGSQEMGAAGRDFEQAARMVAIAKEQADTLAAEDAFTKMRQKQLELTYGDKGVMSLKGAQTINRDVPAEYGGQLTAFANGLSAGLGNDNQRRLFAKRAAVSQLELQQVAFQHVAREQDVYANEVLQGTLETEARVASAGGDVRTSLERINAAVDRYAERFQKPEQEITALKMKAADAIWSSKIKGLVYSDPIQADRLFRDPTINAQIGPTNRPVLEHEIRTALMPVESRADAEAAMKPAEGAAAPQTVNDVRAMLPQWISNAEAEAEKRRPGDAVYRDMVVGRVRNYVSTLVAAQEGEQRQAYGTLIGLLGGVQGGRKPTTQDQLFAVPAARAAFLRLDPPQQVAVLNFIDHNAREAEGKPSQINARLVNQIFPRLFLPPDDPRAIYQPQQLAQFVPQGLTPEGHSVLVRKIQELQTPEGKGFLADVEKLRRTARAMLLHSLTGAVQPDLAEEAALRFSNNLDKKIDEYRKAGKDPRLLITPDTPDYLLKPRYVQTFLQDTRSAIQDAATRQRLAGEKVQSVDPRDVEGSIKAMPTGTAYEQDGMIFRKLPEVSSGVPGMGELSDWVGSDLARKVQGPKKPDILRWKPGEVYRFETGKMRFLGGNPSLAANWEGADVEHTAPSATAVSGKIGEPATPAAPSVPQRKPGESPAAYLQRIGQ